MARFFVSFLLVFFVVVVSVPAGAVPPPECSDMTDVPTAELRALHAVNTEERAHGVLGGLHAHVAEQSMSYTYFERPVHRLLDALDLWLLKKAYRDAEAAGVDPEVARQAYCRALGRAVVADKELLP